MDAPPKTGGESLRVTQHGGLPLYLGFAVLAIAANLMTQEAVVRTAPAAPLAISILAGTIVGFVLKYLLDKRWVFRYEARTRGQEARNVVLYGAFSVFTTLVFWTFEFTAWAIWGTDFAKYAGAVVGLTIGYVAKFILDGRYVFRDGAA